MTANSAQTAAGRLFRVYERHCQNPGLDTLFEVLTAIHSLNDRLKKATERDLLEIEEFIALKVLRNFAHHEEEVHANVRVIPVPAYSDLLFMCIVRRDQVERAIENVDNRWKDSSLGACETRFHWYGDAVNINPCLFNLVVRTYEMLQSMEVFPLKRTLLQLRHPMSTKRRRGTHTTWMVASLQTWQSLMLFCIKWSRNFRVLDGK